MGDPHDISIWLGIEWRRGRDGNAAVASCGGGEGAMMMQMPLLLLPW